LGESHTDSNPLTVKKTLAATNCFFKQDRCGRGDRQDLR